MTDSPQSIITPELRNWIGRNSALAHLETMSASDVRRYVDATGDANPLWLDDDFAQSAGYRSRLLPPTLVGWVPFSMKEAASSFAAADLRRQLPSPTATPTCVMPDPKQSGCNRLMSGSSFPRSRIVDIVARQGRTGLGIYITQEEQILNSRQEIVMRRRHTVAMFPAKTFSDSKKEAE